jgi:general secretion pathway protein B
MPGPNGAARRGTPWIGLLIGAVIVLAALLVWLLLRHDAPAVVASAPVVTAVAAPVVAPTQMPSPTPVPTSTDQPATMPLPSIAPSTVKPPPTARTPRTNPPVVATASTSTAPVTIKPAPVEGTTDNRVYAQSELPDDIRRQLPLIAVGGSMYSPVPANRILIINGQVLHEGERITPEVQLVQIKLKAAVLAFKGYRYELAF